MTAPRPNRAQAQQAALSAALSGAVDLSGLKARAEASRPGAPGADGATPQAASSSPANGVIAVTEENFQDVVEQSMRVPVVLEFVMPGADPQAQYGDLFDSLVAASQGTWILGKVDVQTAPRLVQGMGVEGIPAIRAIFQGQLVAEFAGKQPEAKVREFIKAIVEGTGGTLPDEVGPQEDPRIEEAENAMADGDLDKSEELYKAVMADNPAHELAADAIRQIQLLRRLGDDENADVNAEIEAADADPMDVSKAFRAADFQVASGDAAGAFARLLAIVKAGDDEAKEAARQRIIELFAIVGNADPAVSAARRDLAAALF